MIGRVTGRLGYRASDHALIDAGGVGYVVYCSERTLAALPGQGEWVSLFTEMLVREDAITLFGFLTLAEKEWHRLLTSVQGIGAKGAMAILGTLGADGVGVGKPYLYGLCAGGEAGVRRVFDILRDETERAMGLLGAGTVAEAREANVAGDFEAAGLVRRRAASARDFPDQGAAARGYGGGVW